MDVTATEAKNRLGQMLDHAQREPVIIEKQGRRHSVLMSAAHYDHLVAQSARAAQATQPPRTAQEFYSLHKDWVDACNIRVERDGLWNEDYRSW